jgi:hypothetical protein
MGSERCIMSDRSGQETFQSVEKTIHFKKQNMAYNSKTFIQFLNELFGVMQRENFKSITLIMNNVAFHKTGNVKNFCDEHVHRLIYWYPEKRHGKKPWEKKAWKKVMGKKT